METLIETVRLRNGAAPLWYLHVRRLATSCRALGVPIPVELPTPEGGPDRVHRLLVSRRGVVAGERPVGSMAPVRLITAKVVHRPYPHKLVDRERFDRALADAKAAGADDGCCSRWVAKSRRLRSGESSGGRMGRWWPRRSSSAILPGVARARIEELVGDIAERKDTGGDPWPERVRGERRAGRGSGGLARRHNMPDFAANRALARRFWP